MFARFFFISKLSVFWLFLQFFYTFSWLLHVLLYPYLKWVKRIKFPYTYLHLNMFSQVFGVKLTFLHPKQRELLSTRDCLVLSNHRSWADFFICCLSVNGGRSGYISRAAVGFLLPVVFLWEAFVTRNAVVFNRGADRKKMKKRLHQKMGRFLQRGGLLLVFPEGHRHLGRGTLPLKRGVIKWAYANQQPCAVVLHHGADLVINERLMKVKRGVEVICDHRGIFYPKDFHSSMDFYNRISEEFEVGYKKLEEAVLNDK
jgi:1-acyl-sn-glycerol-3-phosphate acyltransferase